MLPDALPPSPSVRPSLSESLQLSFSFPSLTTQSLPPFIPASLPLLPTGSWQIRQILKKKDNYNNPGLRQRFTQPSEIPENINFRPITEKYFRPRAT